LFEALILSNPYISCVVFPDINFSPLRSTFRFPLFPSWLIPLFLVGTYSLSSPGDGILLRRENQAPLADKCPFIFSVSPPLHFSWSPDFGRLPPDPSPAFPERSPSHRTCPSPAAAMVVSNVPTYFSFFALLSFPSRQAFTSDVSFFFLPPKRRVSPPLLYGRSFSLETSPFFFSGSRPQKTLPPRYPQTYLPQIPDESVALPLQVATSSSSPFDHSVRPPFWGLRDPTPHMEPRTLPPGVFLTFDLSIFSLLCSAVFLSCKLRRLKIPGPDFPLCL